jgi:hypothetical protein
LISTVKEIENENFVKMRKSNQNLDKLSRSRSPTPKNNKASPFGSSAKRFERSFMDGKKGPDPG